MLVLDEDFSSFGCNSTRYAGDSGFRYMIALSGKISIGTDFAIYIEAGDALSQ